MKPLSRMVKLFRRKDFNFVFDADTMSLYEVSDNVARQIEELEAIASEERVTCVVQASDVAPASAQSKGLDRLVLLTTHACNLQCSYCFADYVKTHATPAHMSLDVAKAALRKLAPTGISRLQFFGGEPLISFEVIRSIIGFVEGDLRPLFPTLPVYTLTTNGTLITEALAAYFAEKQIQITVSVDGTKEVHDAQRTTKRGAGSYDSVICGIEHLKKAGLTVRVESVYTANHLSHNQGIVDTVDFLRSVGAEQVHLTPAIGKSGNDLVHINGISLGPDYEKATDSVMDSFLSDKPIKMQYIFYIIEALAQGGKEYLCDAGIKGLTVDTNGDVFPCYAVMHSSVSMGNVLDETFPGTTFAEVKGLLLASKKSTFAKCGRCWARTLCSSCYGDSFAAEKS